MKYVVTDTSLFSSLSSAMYLPPLEGGRYVSVRNADTLRLLEPLLRVPAEAVLRKMKGKGVSVRPVYEQREIFRQASWEKFLRKEKEIYKRIREFFDSLIQKEEEYFTQHGNSKYLLYQTCYINRVASRLLLGTDESLRDIKAPWNWEVQLTLPVYKPPTKEVFVGWEVNFQHIADSYFLPVEGLQVRDWPEWLDVIKENAEAKPQHHKPPKAKGIPIKKCGRF